MVMVSNEVVVVDTVKAMVYMSVSEITFRGSRAAPLPFPVLRRDVFEQAQYCYVEIMYVETYHIF